MVIDYVQQFINSRNSPAPITFLSDISGTNTQGQSNGTDTAFNSATGIFLTRAATKVRLRFDNRDSTGTAGAGGTALADMTVIDPCIEYPLGTFTPVKLSGGDRFVVAAGTVAYSDPVTLPVTIPAQTLCWARFHATVPAAGKWPLNFYSVGGKSPSRTHRFEQGANGTLTNRGRSGTIAAAPGSYTFSASIVAADEVAAPALFVAGDSISLGLNGGTINGIFSSSFIYQACVAQGVPCFMTGLTGSSASSDMARRNIESSGASMAYIEWGTNDLHSGGATLAGVQANILARCFEKSVIGIPCLIQTITPQSPALDGRTVHSANPLRVSYNNWVRDGAPILAGVAVAAGSSAAGTLRIGQVGHPCIKFFEIADVVEDGRDTGLWRVGYTLDGVHPTTAAATLMAAAVVFPSIEAPVALSSLMSPTAAAVALAVRSELTAELALVGDDTAGTTTLLSRLTSQRASNLDNLDAAVSGVGTSAGALFFQLKGSTVPACSCKSRSCASCGGHGEARLFDGDTQARVFFTLDGAGSVVALPLGVSVEVWDSSAKVGDATVAVTDSARWCGTVYIPAATWTSMNPGTYWLRTLDGDDQIVAIQALTVLDPAGVGTGW